MRVLVAFENEYRIYGEVIARVIRELRPSVEVTIAEAETVGEEVGRVLPKLVISSRAQAVGAAHESAWVEFALEHGRKSRICVGGRCSESQVLSFKELLSVVDETQRLSGTGRDP